ncbi:MAG: hypothetical protein NC089_10870 [Bacteroides sp.]|nr:hypothetical protein [Bacteroides sp.]MCM1551029.1 hypothetical protein [Clostridium sp.]
MPKRKKAFKVVIIIISTIFLVVLSSYIIYIYMFHNSKYHDLVKYTEKLLDVNISEYITKSDGYILFDDSEYATIKLQAREGCEQTVADLFDEEFGRRVLPESDSCLYPLSHPVTDIEQELNEKKPEYAFELMLSGTHGQKTRDVWVYIVNDEDGYMYIYIFG